MQSSSKFLKSYSMTQSYSREGITVSSLELTFRLFYRPQRFLWDREMSQLMTLERTDQLHNGKLRGNNTISCETGFGK